MKIPKIGMSMFNCAAVKKMEVISCLFPKLRSEMHRGHGTQLFEKNRMFLCYYGKCYHTLSC